MDDILDIFPDDSNEQQDSDGDSYGDNEDPDDDNDGTWDSVDAFPLDPSESDDTDQDGIGNNTDSDDDNDGINDLNDYAPLNSHCATLEEIQTAFCDGTISEEIVFVEKMGDHMILFVADSTIAYRLSLSTNTLLAPIDFSAHASANDTVTSVEYHPGHDRLYVALASGTTVYFNQNSTHSTYFYTSENNFQSMVAAGDLLIAGEFALGGRGIRPSGEDRAYVLKGSGLLLHTRRWGLDNLNYATWNSDEELLYSQQTYSGLERRTVDQETGIIGANTHSSFTGPGGSWIFSPNLDRVVSFGGHVYSKADIGLTYDRKFSSERFQDILWPESEDLITIRESIGDTVIEQWSAELLKTLSTVYRGTPIAVFYQNSVFYVITGSDELGIKINTYPSQNND